MGQIPVALSIAGSDSSAGAGIQADLKTFSALGVYGLTAVTCVVAETPGRVSKIEPVSAALVHEQIKVLLRSFPVGAIKTGLLFSSEIIREIARALREHRSIPLVIDPVMVATGGDPLLQDDAIGSYEQELFPHAALITPNLDEAACLIGKPIGDLRAMREAGEILANKYGVSILLKGGHLTGDQAIDLLFLNGNIIEFSAPFSRGIATHGTGCTYSAAITAGLAMGLPLEESVRRAKEFVSATIAQHHAWNEIHALNHSLRTW
ncbi:MAG TPA: bifunctional hydroxymethylpyrimidine kinase/phosphomethylpyrimidine kinase [Chthoniobacterales bacterium]|jgi:hydroxymethylpyrimidine/phosphomethylpyrimidine kinase|nr:bifunctional hydroxymethylpyrimidine kinase/phosphomethylpyrimidine kinase [Chthoniobacterales bacterium]